MNPFERLYGACNAGTNSSKLADLADFPKLIDIEPTNACNFRCLMCPTGNLAMKRPSGFMPDAVWHSFITQIKDRKPAIRFIGWGEPTLHPKLPEFIDEANSWGILTHINTNGSKMTEEYASRLALAGLDSIKFSFQGIDRESYKEMRNRDSFEKLKKTVEMVKKMGGPYVHVSTTTTYESQEKIWEFINDFSKIADAVTVGKTIFSHMDLKAVRLKPEEIQRLKMLSAFEPKLSHPKPCPEVFDKLTVQWNGEVRVCCNDYDGKTSLGNVMEKSIKDIWTAPQMVEYRTRLSGDDYGGDLCSNCWDYFE